MDIPLLEQIAGKLRRPMFRTRILLLTRWYLYRRAFFWVLRVLVVLAVAVFIFTYWCAIDIYLSSLEDSVIPEMAIGIGAAITGIIAIAFSLSLFAIQQVADRGTPATLQAYARDTV